VGDGGAANAGYNLVANPYPSAISYERLVSQNSSISGAIYIWDDGGSNTGQRSSSDYIIVNSLGATRTSPSGRDGNWDGNIRSCQGFFVKATSASKLFFTDYMKVSDHNTNTGFFRSKEEKTNSIIRLKLEGDGNYSDMIIAQKVDATDGVDPLYDAYKPLGNDVLQCYSLIGEDAFAIQAISQSFDMQKMDLGLSVNKSGIYTFTFEMRETDNETYQLYDHELDSAIMLNASTSYQFEAQLGTNNTRFDLLVMPNLVLGFKQNINNSSLAIFVENEELKIFSGIEGKGNVEIYGIDGKNVLSLNDVNFENGIARIAFQKEGLFVVKIQTRNETIQGKFIR
jgi:hypothetical protein